MTRHGVTCTDLTIVIPTRDRAELVEKTVRAVLASTVKPGRIVVVDNSQKNPALINALCTRVGGVEYLPPVGDLSFHENHNRALWQSKTPLTCLLQDDDLYSETFVERGVAAMSGWEAPVLFGSNYRVIDEYDNETCARAFPRFPHGLLTPVDYLLYAMENMPPLHHSATMFLTDAAPVGGVSAADGMCSDMGFLFRVAALGSVAMVDEPLSAIRIHSTMASVGAGFVRSGTNPRSAVLAFDSLEWQVKRRFLKEQQAREVLGGHLAEAGRKAAYRASSRLAHEAVRRRTATADRVKCAWTALTIAPYRLLPAA